MRKLSAFNFITLDGYFKGPGEDISWHVHGAEENQFAVESMRSNNTLVFGRVTYDLMAGYWTSPFAKENDPLVAEGMNRSDKIVFSNTLQKADWANTRIVKGDVVKAIKKMKQEPGNDMTILGSGTIVTQFAEHDLIDDYAFMVDPVIIGSGTPLFKNISRKLNLLLTDIKRFKSGVVLLSYQPLRK